MSKNIILCLDGTWNDKEDSSTHSNVALLHEMCVNDGDTQIAYYDTGVGTGNLYDKKLGGLHGAGLSGNIREAYAYLVKEYEESDCVFIFGFSRGAYTARSLAGLLYSCGLLAKNQSQDVSKVFKAYRNSDDGDMEAYKSTNRKCPVRMLGVWDTVGALGIPVSFLKETSNEVFKFHNTRLSPEVDFACHALAADEKRASFHPTLWQETENTESKIRQVWFPGVHSDVGGGYKERHHSDVALKWMVGNSTYCGLLIKDENTYKYNIELDKDIHESALRIFDLEIGVKRRDAPVTAENIPTVHSSIREKMKLVDSYKPLALAEHITDPITLSPYNVEA